MRASRASRVLSRRPLWERITGWWPGRSRDGICPSRWHEMRASLEAGGPLRVAHVDLPGTDTTLHMTRPYPVIIDPDQRVPFWSEIWPSGVVLAGVIAREPSALHGRRVLELGPGIGVTAVAALQAGADLVIADAAADALELCAFNALDQAGREPRTVLVNWRKPTAELFAAAGEGFSLVLAADALYEEEDVKPLLALLEQIVAPGGELWLAEPGRHPAAHLVKAIRKRGWRGPSERYNNDVPDPHDHGRDPVTVHRLRRPGA